MRSMIVLASLMLAVASWSVGDLHAAPVDEFVSDSQCVTCHAEAAAAWESSHHAAAMQPASAATVLGDFDGVSFEDAGVSSRFFKRDDRFFIRTQGHDGQVADFEVRYTFGVAPLQQYLVEAPGGRLQAFTVAWDVQERRWFSLYPGERFAPDDALHWTGRYQNWNAMCAECHSTNLRKGYDPQADTFATQWSEINVGCQACHGPGARHVAWADEKASGRSQASDDRGLVVDFASQDARYQVEQCARCHSRRQRVSEEDAHGRAFLDDFVPQMLRADLYHADGQIDGEVYVYGSFLQSKMYAAGVRCTDCHDAHGGTIKAEGNALCTRCHGPQPDARFEDLQAKRYDSPEHHFHAAGSSGAACVACHMPGKLYMQVDHRRDHGFRLPRPAESDSHGTPNACNGCHSDRDAKWAAAEIEARFGRPTAPHPFAAALAAEREGRPDAGRRLAALAEDTSMPALARATAVEQLGAHGPVGGRAVALALSDPSPLVRLGALRALEQYPPRTLVAGAVPRLTDERRAVRIEAARLLSAFPLGQLDTQTRSRHDAALVEYEQAQQARSDLPSGRLNLAVLAERRGDDALALAQYQMALSFDPYFTPARFNLANLLSRLERRAEAEAVLREGVRRTPEVGELHYSLGLLLAESEEMHDAVDSLRRAADLLPQRSRVHYNLGMALQHTGRGSQAERALLRAQRLDSNDSDVVHALALHYVATDQWQPAEEQAQRLVRLRPGAREASAMLNDIRMLRRYSRKP